MSAGKASFLQLAIEFLMNFGISIGQSPGFRPGVPPHRDDGADQSEVTV
jgi:hypothetical protein